MPSKIGQGQPPGFDLPYRPETARGMEILSAGPGTEALFAPARGPGRKDGIAPETRAGHATRNPKPPEVRLSRLPAAFAASPSPPFSRFLSS